ncbi:MAG TPA: lysophospholipid acyltransferase family protein [Ignavibacteriales bacterium]|nr:lysophospholipid acyltransferase family protein [Ignavibacteriales bacterium]
MKPKKLGQDILRFLGNYFLYSGISLLLKTLKINSRNREHFDRLVKEKKNFVFAFWHGSMLIPWYINKDLDFSALVSRSKDGSLLDKILTKWNYRVIRGSSNDGGSMALKLLLQAASSGRPVAITPDGPKGPYHKLKAGAVVVAKKAGIPLILVGVGVKKKRILGSWDRFELPKFFTSINLVFSDPVSVCSELSYEETTKLIEECECKLNDLQEEAGNF